MQRLRTLSTKVRVTNAKYNWEELEAWFMSSNYMSVSKFFREDSRVVARYGSMDSTLNGGIGRRTKGWAEKKKQIGLRMIEAVQQEVMDKAAEKFRQYAEQIPDIEMNSMAIAAANVITANEKVVLWKDIEKKALGGNGYISIEELRPLARPSNYEVTIGDIKKLWEMARVTQNKPISSTKTENIERKDTTVILKQVLESVSAGLPTSNSVYDAISQCGDNQTNIIDS